MKLTGVEKIILFLPALLFMTSPVFAESRLNNQCDAASTYLEEGNKLLESAPVKAEALFMEALKKCPESTNASYNLAVSLYSQKKNTKAVEVLKSLLNSNPDKADAMRFLAYILVKENIDPTKGKALAEKMLEANPKDEGAKKIVMLALMDSIPDAAEAESAPRTVVKSHLRKKAEPAPAGASDVDNDIPVTEIKNPNAIAVIIGNRDYDNKDVPSVDYAINDAETVRKYLVNVLGYREGNIIMETNASKGKFEAIFGTKEDYKGKLHRYLQKGKSDIFVFYAGHGAPDPQTRQGYFVPVDADTNDIKLAGYPLKQMYENIAKTAKDMNTPNVFIVVDSCFSGGTAGGELILKNVSPIGIVVENPLLTMKNAVVMTSSSGSEVSSWYPEKGHSMFTYFFLKALKDEAGKGVQKVTAAEVFKQITDETEGLPYYARRLHGRDQTPQLMGDENRVILKK